MQCASCVLHSLRLLVLCLPLHAICHIAALAAQGVAFVHKLAVGYLSWFLLFSHSVTYIHALRLLKSLTMLVCSQLVVAHLVLNVLAQLHLLQLCQPLYLPHAKQQPALHAHAAISKHTGYCQHILRHCLLCAHHVPQHTTLLFYLHSMRSCKVAHPYVGICQLIAQRILNKLLETKHPVRLLIACWLLSLALPLKHLPLRLLVFALCLHCLCKLTEHKAQIVHVAVSTLPKTMLNCIAVCLSNEAVLFLYVHCFWFFIVFSSF